MDTEMINDKVSQGIMLISAEKYDAAKLLREDIIAEAPRTMEAYIHLGNACYYEEPYAGKPHVRICEGLRLRGLSLLDCRAKNSTE